MDILYFSAGLLAGSSISYVWYMVGRNTSYQDKNIIPPPSPLPKIVPEAKQKQPGPAWVDDFTDPSMGRTNVEEE